VIIPSSEGYGDSLPVTYFFEPFDQADMSQTSDDWILADGEFNPVIDNIVAYRPLIVSWISWQSIDI